MIRQIRTAVTPKEAEELERIAMGRTVLELGSHFGFSTVVMARVALRVVAVDWHRGDGHAGPDSTLTDYFQNLDDYEVRDKVISMVGRFEDVLPMLKHDSFDAAFIDGQHLYEDVKRDAIMTLPLLKPESFLAFHDYGPEHFGVKQAVDDLFPTHPMRRFDNLVTVQL